jgi:formamidopyrimidine-DNA glycosylase
VPELPEVEVLRCHLEPRLIGKRIKRVEILKSRLVRPESGRELAEAIEGCTIKSVGRKGKFLRLNLARSRLRLAFPLTIHLGMTGRLFVQSMNEPLPKHAAVAFGLGRERLVFKDVRTFGRVTLETDSIDQLGADALSDAFSVESLSEAFASTGQAVKVRLMDQRFIAGLGNIYACEVLHLAKVSPFAKSSALPLAKRKALHRAIRTTLARQVEFGKGLDLDFPGEGQNDGLFYFGSTLNQAQNSKERFRVYGREGKPCRTCGAEIERVEQAKRGTFFCRSCQAE